MQFLFQVNLTEKDYLDYNKFWQFQSPYGKKQIVSLRVLFAVLFGLFALTALLSGDFSIDSIIEAILHVIVMVIFQFALAPFFAWAVKRHLKSLKKKGKMAYSPVSEMNFHDEVFTETTPEVKNEVKYSMVERISVTEEKTVYIHVNNLAAYILPYNTFDSQEQYESFLTFLKEKCTNLK